MSRARKHANCCGTETHFSILHQYLSKAVITGYSLHCYHHTPNLSNSIYIYTTIRLQLVALLPSLICNDVNTCQMWINISTHYSLMMLYKEQWLWKCYHSPWIYECLGMPVTKCPCDDCHVTWPWKTIQEKRHLLHRFLPSCKHYMIQILN